MVAEGNSDPDVVLSVQGLSKSYGDVAAVRDLSLQVHRGEVFGFLGPNGAGKTTTISMICGLLGSDPGTAPGTPGSLNAGEAVIAELERAVYPDGSKALMVRRESDHDAALRGLKDRTADVVVEIPPEFTKTLLEYAQGRQPPPALVKTYGDPTNTRYLMAGAWGDAVVFQ